MKKWIAATFFPILMYSASAEAAISGEELLQRCTAAEKSVDGVSVSAEEMLDAMWCMGYMSGLLDGFSVGDYEVGNARMMCPPEGGLTRTQALKIVTEWLRKHPEARQKSGRRDALLALASAYPCQR